MSRRSSAWCILALGLVALACWGSRFASLDGIKEKVRQDFPEVVQWSTEHLAQELENGSELLLLDVRRAEEYAVSHLPGAIRIEPWSDEIDLPDGVTAETRIVAYCSVGYRSSEMVRRLHAQGYGGAVNLEGSIFEWADRGLPLVQGTRPVSKVHPYGRAWAWMVARELRAYTPEDALQESEIDTVPAVAAGQGMP